MELETKKDVETLKQILLLKFSLLDEEKQAIAIKKIEELTNLQK